MLLTSFRLLVGIWLCGILIESLPHFSPIGNRFCRKTFRCVVGDVTLTGYTKGFSNVENYEENAYEITNSLTVFQALKIAQKFKIS